MGKLRSGNKTTKSGFTIVEISIATAFISILMIVISVVIINIVGIYQKGTVMKNLNSTGRALVDDIEKSIEAASPANVISKNQTTTKYQWDKYYNQNSDSNIGVFCPGQYSYIWAGPNREGEIANVTLRYGNNKNRSGFRLLKVKDRDRNICQKFDPSSPASINLGSTIINDSDIEELLDSNDVDLYVLSFSANEVDGKISKNQVASNVSEVFFSGDFTLGTKRGTQYDTDTQLSNCKVGANDTEGEFNYCAVNKFKFAARTAGKVF